MTHLCWQRRQRATCAGFYAGHSAASRPRSRGPLDVAGCECRRPSQAAYVHERAAYAHERARALHALSPCPFPSEFFELVESAVEKWAPFFDVKKALSENFASVFRFLNRLGSFLTKFFLAVFIFVQRIAPA